MFLLHSITYDCNLIVFWHATFSDFPHSLVGKESACNAGDLGSIPGLGRSPAEGNGNLLQYSCLENPMDKGAWWATVHGVARVGHDLATKPPNHATFYTYLEKYPCILLSSLILLKTTRSNILTVCSSKKILYTIILNFYHHIKTIWSGNDNILYY